MFTHLVQEEECTDKAEEVCKILKNEHKKVQPYLFCTFSCSVTRNTNQYSLTHIYAGYFNAHRASHNKGLGKLKSLTDDFEVMVERTRSTDVLMLQSICRGRGLG